MSNFNEDALFDKDVSGAVSQLLNNYQNGGLSKDEYPLALLNLYGMMLVSQLKRIADTAERTEDHLKEIRHELDTLKEIRDAVRTNSEGLGHIFEGIVQLEMNTRK